MIEVCILSLFTVALQIVLQFVHHVGNKANEMLEEFYVKMQSQYGNVLLVFQQIINKCSNWLNKSPKLRMLQINNKTSTVLCATMNHL